MTIYAVHFKKHLDDFDHFFMKVARQLVSHYFGGENWRSGFESGTSVPNNYEQHASLCFRQTDFFKVLKMFAKY